MSCPKSAISNAMLSENSLYVGINLQSILYGILLGLYVKTVHVFLVRRREPQGSDAFHALFSSIALVLITIRVSTEGIYGQKMWLINRNYPGGPIAYGEAHASDVYMALGATAVVVLQQMIGALMMYRCRIMWESFGVIIVPAVLWLAELALGILVSWVAAAPLFKFFGGISGKLGLAYAAVSVCLNSALTCMLWYRLACHARSMRKCNAEGQHMYFTADAFVVETLLPYTLCGIAVLISCGVGSETAIAFSSVYNLMMCVSSQMLILRIAEGNAWQRGKVGESLVGPEGSGAIALVHLEALRYDK